MWRKYHPFLEINFWQKSSTVPNETAPLPYTPGKLTLLLQQCAETALCDILSYTWEWTVSFCLTRRMEIIFTLIFTFVFFRIRLIKLHCTEYVDWNCSHLPKILYYLKVKYLGEFESIFRTNLRYESRESNAEKNVKNLMYVYL